MAAVSFSVFPRSLSHLLQPFPRSPPSRPRGNHRDIFSDPISTTCYRRELLPYRARVFRLRASLGYEVYPLPPVRRRNALSQERARCPLLSLPRDIVGF